MITLCGAAFAGVLAGAGLTADAPRLRSPSRQRPRRRGAARNLALATGRLTAALVLATLCACSPAPPAKPLAVSKAQLAPQATAGETADPKAASDMRWRFITRARGVDYYLQTFPLATEDEGRIWVMSRQVGGKLGQDTDLPGFKLFKVVRQEVLIGFNCRDREIVTQGKLSHGAAGQEHLHPSMYGFGGKPPAGDPFSKMMQVACREIETEAPTQIDRLQDPRPGPNDRFAPVLRDAGQAFALRTDPTPERDDDRVTVTLRTTGADLDDDAVTSGGPRFKVLATYDRLWMQCRDREVSSSWRAAVGEHGEARLHPMWSATWKPSRRSSVGRVMAQVCASRSVGNPAPTKGSDVSPRLNGTGKP